MAIVVTPVQRSLPLVDFCYQITGLVNGVNAITLPTPPAKGSFPPAADWTPVQILVFPYNTAAVGAVVTPDYTSITNTNGVIAFNLWANGATNALVYVA